ncbi:alpha/beta-hydrolase [Byssothecium circinans]|uniref:Alpha/beta-hydrolase n=1 Tax=Byssothecium circinans TaxID=147558 RepID=A0A6A5TNC1_9PLEO|nr:alpha/beta-hydrolase [Byssothecium circinans]
MSSFYNRIIIPLCFGSGLWLPAMLLCCVPWVQKQITLWPGKWLDEPERAGFLKNQVAPFRVTTKDGERLFAWLIAPLGAYAKNANDFIEEKPGGDDIEEKVAFKLLKEDPDARLLLYMHGNTATIAQGRRTEEYRSYSAGLSDKIFILAFDYRGFGKSTGSPSESGVLNDAEAALDWAIHTANISPDRIVLLGHSLGTAVATGLAHRYANANTATPIQFGGLILCAAFTNAGAAFSAYSVADVLPLLAPVKMIPALQNWFTRRMRDTWRTDHRLKELVQWCDRLQLTLVHAEDDGTLPWNMTEELFASTLKAATGSAEQAKVKIIDLAEAGRQEIWSDGNRSISKLIAKHGDHNTMMKWTPISLAILEAFGATTINTTTRH